LEYNIETMRITDAGGEESSGGVNANSILNQIKTSTVINSMANTSVPVAEVKSTELKNMLAKLKTRE
jgi:hypothetical protein